MHGELHTINDYYYEGKKKHQGRSGSRNLVTNGVKWKRSTLYLGDHAHQETPILK